MSSHLKQYKPFPLFFFPPGDLLSMCAQYKKKEKRKSFYSFCSAIFCTNLTFADIPFHVFNEIFIV